MSPKYRRSLVWLLLPTLSIAGASCTETSQADNTKTAVAVEVLPVLELVAQDTVLHHDYVADIQSIKNVEVRARVQGFIEKIYVDEGKEVKAGQPLFRINDAEYKTQLAKARANLSNAVAQSRVAQLEAERVRLLVDKKIIAKSELEVAQAKLRAAQAQIDEARSAQSTAALSLSYTMVRAPFDGIIDRIPLKVGSLVDNGTLLTTVSDNRAVYAYFGVSEGEYLEYIKTRQQHPSRNNNSVQLILADGSQYTPPGKIETVESEFNEGTGSISFRARFDNPHKILKHGATGRVRLSNTVHDVVLVPQKAVFEIQDKNYVFVVDAAGKVKQKSFVPSTRLSYFYVVKSGLKPGEKIVYEGMQDLREGATIRPRPVLMGQILAGAH
ncbi:efflux RND transporter periplasmic adaptor subunit [Hymenobacter jejuensis]|uniref:Efflux RND transporter periplasmic adaptor subunit n=1 Tax=Hymenobacter jejuensis TaxID=2502781 RepID=A0A5B8A2X1_9BACT|nr:efflux RND transporter periplasmic adaptor subunit [Hymenobacter jejuensis]